MHATCLSRHRAACRFRPCAGAACSRIMISGNRDRSPFAMHGLHRFAFDFFDSHFFALRFAVVSQSPKIDSQTAMRNRINYSLYPPWCYSGLQSPLERPHRSFGRKGCWLRSPVPNPCFPPQDAWNGHSSLLCCIYSPTPGVL